MKFIYSIVFLLGLFFTTSLTAQTNVDMANATTVSSFPYTETNISSENGGDDMRTTPICFATCCSTLVYKVILPVDGSLFVEMDNFVHLAGSIMAFSSNVANPTPSDLVYINSTGNFCGFRDTLQLGRGYRWWAPTPSWHDVNDYISAGTYYVFFWNVNNQVSFNLGGTTNLTFRFKPACDDTQPQPEIEVEGNSVNIPINDNTPSENDHTDFGTHITGGSSITRTFTIKNVHATNSLDVSSVSISGTNADDFMITASPSSTVNGNSNTTFTVQFTPTAIGTNTATININNSDCDKAAYAFDIKAFVLGTAPSDVRGQMFEFSGSSEYILIDDVAEDMDGATTFTFEAWINVDVGQAGNDRIISVNTSGGGNVVLFYIDDGKVVTYDGANDTYSSPDLRGTGWHHVAFTHDNSQHRVYLDGVLLATKNGSVSTFASNNKWSIGQEYDSGLSFGDYFQGKMDEIRIWNDVRSQQEIRENMNRTFTLEEVKTNAENLKAYYQFDNDDPAGTANGVKDIMGNHGTSTGGTYSASEVAVGGGTTDIQTVNADGTYTFTGTGLELSFTSAGGQNLPMGDISVTKITTEKPINISTNEMTNEPGVYWVIRNYGTNTNLGVAAKFIFADGEIDDNVTTNHFVHKRGSNTFGGLNWLDITPATVGATAGDNHITANLTSFSQFSVSSNTSDFMPSVLPVELTHFDAQRIGKNTVTLTWTTATEINNHGFEIERMDGNDGEFKSVGWVTGNGTTTEFSNYDYEDMNSFKGTSYYRLKQIDFDGVYEYSDVVAVDNQSLRNEEVKLYPNPTTNNLIVQNAVGQVTIFNILGQPVMELGVRGSRFGIDVSRLPNGQYMLQVLSEDGQRTVKRFVKN